MPHAENNFENQLGEEGSEREFESKPWYENTLSILIGYAIVIVTFSCAFVFGIHLLLVVTVCVAFFLLFSKHTEPLGLLQLVTEIGLAIGISYAILRLIKTDEPSQGAQGAGTTLAWFSENIAMATLVGFMLLCLTITLKAVNSVRDTKEVSKEVSEQNKNLKSTIRKLSSVTEKIENHAGKLDYVDLVNQALELRATVKNDNGENERVRALEAGMGTMRSWAENSSTKLDKISDDNELKNSASAASWWKILESYSYEERFDLTQFEMATNVRNYVVLLIAALETFREKVAEQSSTKELVVLQCSTFAAKDFINFPFGAGKNRRYWDAEFFGTYRRSLSAIFALPYVKPYRIVLCYESQDSKTDSEDYQNFYKKGIRVESKSHHLLMSTILTGCSYAVPVSDDPNDFFLRDHLARVVDEDVTPLTSEFMNNTPNFCLLRPTATVATGNAAHTAYRDKFAKIYRDSNRTKVDPHDDLKVFKRTCGDACFQSFLCKREKQYWSEILELQSIVKTTKIDGQTSKTGRALSEVARKIMTLCNDISIARSDVLNTRNEKEWRKFEETLGSKIGSIVMDCQKLDALYAEYCSINQDETFSTITTGTLQKMARAEHWLYHFMNYLDADTHDAIYAEHSRMVPVWDMFATDMLGVGRSNLFETEKIDWPSRKTSMFSPKVRFLNLNNGGELAQNLAKEITSGDLSTEFMLLGVRDKTTSANTGIDQENFESVDWGLLVTSDVAEPYNSCRLGFHLNDDGNKFSIHEKFVENAWADEDIKNNSDAFCESIVAALKENKV